MCTVQVSICSTIICAIQVIWLGLKPISPPQTQGGCETNLRLSTKVGRRPLGCDLVKISAS